MKQLILLPLILLACKQKPKVNDTPVFQVHVRPECNVELSEEYVVLTNGAAFKVYYNDYPLVWNTLQQSYRFQRNKEFADIDKYFFDSCDAKSAARSAGFEMNPWVNIRKAKDAVQMTDFKPVK